MGFLSVLTGGSKAIDKVLDAAIAGGDKLILTEEEKLDYNKETQSMYLEFMRISASESTAQSISRRLICLPVVYIWLGLIVTNAALAIFDMPGVTVIAGTIDSMNMPALAAIGFYVGRHMINKATLGK